MSGDARRIAKRHHTVPKFYLRGFAERDQIGTIRLPGEQRFIQSVGSATVSNNFYALDGHPDGADVIEIGLSEIEGAAAEVFKKIGRNSWPLAYEDRMMLGYFVALQTARIPSQRITLDHLAAQVVRLQVGAGGKAGLRRRLEKNGQEVSDELVDRLWEQATRPEGPPIKRPRAEHIEQLFTTAEELLKYIVGRPWSLVLFDRRSLITSDSPVALIGNASDDPHEGVGFMTAWGIAFPLSRKRGLLMGSVEPLIEAHIPVEEVHQGAGDVVMGGTSQLESFFNFHTAANASEWLFHHPEDARYVPVTLPDPRPITVEMAGPTQQFTGEPWFEREGQ